MVVSEKGCPQQLALPHSVSAEAPIAKEKRTPPFDLRWNYKRHAVSLQFGDDLSQMHQAPGKPIQLEGHYGIHLATTHERHEFVQPVAACLGSRRGIGEPAHPLPAPLLALVFQFRPLAFVRLMFSADAEVKSDSPEEESLKIILQLT